MKIATAGLLVPAVLTAVFWTSSVRADGRSDALLALADAQNSPVICHQPLNQVAFGALVDSLAAQFAPRFKTDLAKLAKQRFATMQNLTKQLREDFCIRMDHTLLTNGLLEQQAPGPLKHVSVARQ